MKFEEAIEIVSKMDKGAWIVTASNIETTRQACEAVGTVATWHQFLIDRGLGDYRKFKI